MSHADVRQHIPVLCSDMAQDSLLVSTGQCWDCQSPLMDKDRKKGGLKALY